MSKQRIHYADHYAAVMRAMTGGGLLLGSYDSAGRPNIMTIGWGAVGSVWGLPTWIVLVRPSRYTYHCIEHSGAFTVNVPTAAMAQACALAGSTSGADTDKFAVAALTAQRAGTVPAPVVAECPIVYECQVVHSNDVVPERLAPGPAGMYADGQFHRVYYGKILAALAEPDAASLLGS
jgi:flavin reductase (DIM6/NTAB) family NADH-FMN oxidoreductase RutF